MTITKKIPADRWHGLDVHQGDSLQVIAVTESEFLVQISRADTPPEPSVGQAGEWLRSARGSVQMAAGISADDARMAFYAAKYGLWRRQRGQELNRRFSLIFRSRKIHLIGESRERRNRVFSAFRYRLCVANGLAGSA